MGRVAGLRPRTPRLLGAGLLLLATACGHGPSQPEPGREVVHVVKQGETLYRIARYYGVSTKRVIAANSVRDVTTLRPGQRLRIPGARREPPDHALPWPKGVPRGGEGAPAAASNGDARRQALAEGQLAFIWPVRGRLTSRFGWRGRRPHEGIDLAAPKGTPVRAAERGRVIYSGNGLGAYGNVIVVRHPGRYDTVYAHNRRNKVRSGARVEKGQVIAELGSTGNATGPHLHFEIRRRDAPRDPLLYLP